MFPTPSRGGTGCGGSWVEDVPSPPPPRRRLRVSAEALRRDPVEIVDGALRHLKVLRLSPGDRVALFDGAGTEVEAELLEVGPERALARAGGRIEHDVEADLDVVVVQAVPVRLQRLDPVVRQLTELGVRAFVPVVSRHGRGTVATVEGRLDRWRRIADSAAEQCGRRRVMAIAGSGVFDEIPWEDLPRPLLILDPGADPGALEPVLQAGPEAGERGPGPGEGGSPAIPGVPGAPGVTLLVGPEGGWSPEELATARGGHGAIPVGLGPRVLRADTAGVVAATVVLHRWGDLG